MSTPKLPARDRHSINLEWLVRLRWGAVAGQLAVVLAVEAFMDIELPIAALLITIGVELASNLRDHATVSLCARDPWSGRLTLEAPPWPRAAALGLGPPSDFGLWQTVQWHYAATGTVLGKYARALRDHDTVRTRFVRRGDDPLCRAVARHWPEVTAEAA